MTNFPSSLPTTPDAPSRRTFLRVAGASAATVGLVLAGCGKNDPTPASTSATVLSFGTDTNTDKRVLNYLFFIKQLEFAFYDKVVSAFPADIPAAEQDQLRDVHEHELIQQQVLANVLGAAALSQLDFHFDSVSLTSRAGVLAAAKLLEDTGSGAFLGILPLLKGETFFTFASKMASAEARHAALMRDLLAPGTFANDDIITASGAQAGQAIALTPTQVAAVLTPFVPGLTINIDSLPTA